MVSTLGPPERVRQPVDRFRWMVAATCAPFLLVVLAHHVRTPTTNRLAVSVAALTLAAHVPTTATFSELPGAVGVLTLPCRSSGLPAAPRWATTADH